MQRGGGGAYIYFPFGANCGQSLHNGVLANCPFVTLHNLFACGALLKASIYNGATDTSFGRFEKLEGYIQASIPYRQ